MHPEILNNDQKQLLPLLKLFRREFYLVGGTAIALQIGHRKSIDFDLFKATPFSSKKIINKIDAENFTYNVTRRVREQLNINVLNVKITFFEYPYPVEHSMDYNKNINMPDLLTLAAMKAFALGRRSKWKDYVDLYFLLKEHFMITQIEQKAQSIYKQEFSEKLFRAQLAYHTDIDYTEEVCFLPGFKVNPEEIKQFLIDISLKI
jgi:hypothetical protein